MEVLLDGLEGGLEHGALLRAETPALRGRVDFVLRKGGREKVRRCKMKAGMHQYFDFCPNGEPKLGNIWYNFVKSC